MLNSPTKRQKVEEVFDSSPLKGESKGMHLDSGSSDMIEKSGEHSNTNNVSELTVMMKINTNKHEKPKETTSKTTSKGKCIKGKVKRRNLKSPHHRIINQLPKEIREKLDSSKENVSDMCKTLTLPKDYKSEHVIRWMRKVSQNELKLIHDEIFKIRMNEKKLKRSERFSMDNLESKGISMYSQRSETSSKMNSERCTINRSRDTPNRIINYNAVLAEDNSACSKTSSNTKKGPNLVRIPLRLDENKVDLVKKEVKVEPFKYLKQQAKLVSVVPGKNILIKFEDATPAE